MFWKDNKSNYIIMRLIVDLIYLFKNRNSFLHILKIMVKI
jgi:hypothetical protein